MTTEGLPFLVSRKRPSGEDATLLTIWAMLASASTSAFTLSGENSSLAM
jgi:hypothetical protein